MIGTFYRSAGPDKAPFVNVGDEIKAGQVVCIIEAMKLFNEIERDINKKYEYCKHDGKIFHRFKNTNI